MKSQHLRIIILLFLIALIGFFGYRNYKQIATKSNSPLLLIPTNASLILQINDFEELKRKLNNSVIWNNCRLSTYANSLHSDIQHLDSIIEFAYNSEKTQTNKLFFSTHKSSYNDAAILFSTTIENSFNLKDLIAKTIGVRQNEILIHDYENEDILELQIKSKKYFITEIEGVIFGSKSKILVQDAIRQSGAKSNLLSNKAFLKVKETTSDYAVANLYYNFNHLTELADIYIEEKIQKNIFLNHFSDWAATDIFIKNNSFFANGLLDANKKDNYLTALKNQKSAKQNIQNIIPHNTSILLTLSFSNTKMLADKKNSFLQRHNAYYSWEKKKKNLQENYKFELNEFLKYVEQEIGVFTIASKSKDTFEQSYSFIKSKNINQSTIFLSELVNSEDKSEYLEQTIFNIKEPKLLSFLFGDIFSAKENSYFVAIEDYLIFGNSSSAVQYVIDNFKSRNTLSSSNHFKKFSQQISEKSNFFFYVNPGKSADLLNNSLNKKWGDLLAINEDSLQKFTAFAYQLNVGSPLFLNNIILFYDEEFKEELKQEWYGQLDTSFAMNPQIIYNYITKKEQVFVQDLSNKIYLFSTSGEKLWEKQIDEQIIGNVSQIDFYKNKKMQILFNSKNKLYIIDRLGRWLEDYPKKLTFQATNGHALFDYTKNRNYRILIAGNDGMLYNFNKKVKAVSGWKFKKTNSKLVNPAKHFVQNGKDYILYASKDKNTQLLARNGTKRVSYNSIPIFNDSPFQTDSEGTIYGITNEGKLWRAKVDGNTTELPLTNLIPNSKFLITDNNLIYSNNKTVFVLDKNFELLHTFNLGYKVEEISHYNGNLVIKTTTSIYVCKDGEFKEGTPIETDGFTAVNDLDKDGKLNLIISRDAFLYNFEIE
ncbi:MAG: hypothetical protein CBC83_00945 [Flavobacteriales bacterium TMED123]|nr:MAG: hypothetical protein CBC83_00945 [Flavobacteriales bacterium TMED123]|tara:strand:- start:2088 stop:4721 length:2634 start_codon:yes stop_codon:yes gene_type:complete